MSLALCAALCLAFAAASAAPTEPIDCEKAGGQHEFHSEAEAEAYKAKVEAACPNIKLLSGKPPPPRPIGPIDCDKAGGQHEFYSEEEAKAYIAKAEAACPGLKLTPKNKRSAESEHVSEHVHEEVHEEEEESGKRSAESDESFSSSSEEDDFYKKRAVERVHVSEHVHEAVKAGKRSAESVHVSEDVHEEVHEEEEESGKRSAEIDCDSIKGEELHFLSEESAEAFNAKVEAACPGLKFTPKNKRSAESDEEESDESFSSSSEDEDDLGFNKRGIWTTTIDETKPDKRSLKVNYVDPDATKRSADFDCDKVVGVKHEFHSKAEAEAYNAAVEANCPGIKLIKGPDA